MLKSVKGDKIDELLCSYLNKANLDFEIKRLGEGKYMFGSRQIMCKIVNGNLLIRVGGGFMSIDEFIEKYGKMEMIKAMTKNNQDAKKTNQDSRKSISSG